MFAIFASLILLTGSLKLSTASTTSECAWSPTLEDPNSLNQANFEELKNRLRAILEDKDKTFLTSIKFEFGFGCESSGSKVDGLQNTNNSKSFGKASSSKLQVKNPSDSKDVTWANVKFMDGDICPENNATKMHSSVLVFCDKTSPKVSWISLDNVNCSKSFLVTSQTFCDRYTPPPATSTDHGTGKSFSGVGAFFFILFLFVSGYFLLGFLYRRYVSGAQGYEQIPHYVFFRRLFRAMPFGGPYYQRPTTGGDPSYRNYDENDDFRYDQPPLMAGTDSDMPNGGGHRAAPNRAGVGTKDDSDVRLLVV